MRSNTTLRYRHTRNRRYYQALGRYCRALVILRHAIKECQSLDPDRYHMVNESDYTWQAVERDTCGLAWSIDTAISSIDGLLVGGVDGFLEDLRDEETKITTNTPQRSHHASV